jgi:hypothetical protein
MFNLRKKSAKAKHELTNKSLDKQRKDKGFESVDGKGAYNSHLEKTRKDKDLDHTTDKQLDPHHENAKENKTIEARMDDDRELFSGNWRDDRTHKTNTLPINELAEENQRARMEAAGQGSGIDESHFQEYKKKDLGLSKEDWGELKDAIKQIDKLWMASSSNRLTTGEKMRITQLQARRDSFLDK